MYLTGQVVEVPGSNPGTPTHFPIVDFRISKYFMTKSEFLTISRILRDKKLRKFIESDLNISLSSIGFSKKFINSLIDFLDNLQVEKFIKKHKNELNRIHNMTYAL